MPQVRHGRHTLGDGLMMDIDSPKTCPDWISRVRFDDKGLVPVIVQDAKEKGVLMLGYANGEALERTWADGLATFWSRERKRIWVKGETSGNKMRVESISLDCDGDAVLLRVTPEGPACHTGQRSCFHDEVGAPNGSETSAGVSPPGRPGSSKPEGAESQDIGEMIDEVYGVILGRIREMPESSYVASLARKGLDAALKKIGEEAVEVVMAAKDGDGDALVRELADLWFHLLVVMGMAGVTPCDVAQELGRRRKEGK